MSGSGDLFIAGGVESMTRVPMPGFNPMLNPSLIDINAYIGMGHTAENLAKKHSISRLEQEEMSLLSHQKAFEAQNKGKLDDEIVKAIPEEDVDRTSAEGKASSVQFIHFKFNEKQIEKFRSKVLQVELGINHNEYSHATKITDETLSSLSKDFS